MGAFDFPTAPDAQFEKFLEQSAAIEGERLQAAVPKDYFEPRVWRGVLGFAVSWLVYAGAIVGVAYSPHWALYLPLWIVAGLGAGACTASRTTRGTAPSPATGS